MHHVLRSRPSPAIFVAVLVLVAALVGTAVAGPNATTAKLNAGEKKQVKKIAKKIAKKQGKKQGKKQANKQIAEKAPGLSVDNAAKLAGEGPGAFQKRSRWALVEDSSGVVGGASITAQSGGITVLAEPSTGRYILGFGSSVVDHAILATPNQFSGAATPEALAVAVCQAGVPGGTPDPALSCGAANVSPSNVLVDVEDDDGSQDDGDFWIAVLE